jgi:hypothetical protein
MPAHNHIDVFQNQMDKEQLADSLRRACHQPQGI